MDQALQQTIQSIQSQETTWMKSGYTKLMEKSTSNQDYSSGGFYSGDVLDAILEEVSGGKIFSGTSKSVGGLMEANWDKGYIKITFPTDDGYLIIGNCGKDINGNEMQGILLHDGSNPIGHWGRQAGGY